MMLWYLSFFVSAPGSTSVFLGTLEQGYVWRPPKGPLWAPLRPHMQAAVIPAQRPHANNASETRFN